MSRYAHPVVAISVAYGAHEVEAEVDAATLKAILTTLENPHAAGTLTLNLTGGAETVIIPWRAIHGVTTITSR